MLRHGVTVTGAILVAAIVLAAGFDHDHPSKMQATTDISWIPALDVRIHLGIDGISLPLLVLTALLTFLCALYSYFKMPEGPSPKAFVALLLVLESGTLATFAVLDLLLFFLAFEMVLIPMYFLIARWGGAKKQAAAWKFILYTLLGSVVMLLGLLLIGLKSGTFDMVALATDNGRGLTSSVQVIAVLAIGVGLAVKTPMWPLHSWLPDAHTAAPTVGSVLLAGVLLKMGTYGFVRILLPITPDGMHTFAPYLAAFAVVGIIYGSLACLALVRPGSKGDLKRLIAYSSVGHMGFVLLGIASMTPTGVNGALFANIAHGLITGLLFFLVGAVKDRYGTADLDTLSGATGAALYGRAPASAASSPSPPSPPWDCRGSPDSGARCSPCSAPSTPPTASAARPSSPSCRSPRSAPCSPPRTCSWWYAGSAWARSAKSRSSPMSRRTSSPPGPRSSRSPSSPVCGPPSSSASPTRPCRSSSQEASRDPSRRHPGRRHPGTRHHRGREHHQPHPVRRLARDRTPVVVAAMALIVLVTDLFLPEHRKPLLGTLTIVGLAAALALLVPLRAA